MKVVVCIEIVECCYPQIPRWES